MPYRSNRLQVIQALNNATDAGTFAGASVLRNAVVRRLMKGYTTGAFATGARGIAGSVTISDPLMIRGARARAVGTDRIYGVFWELGHHNTFTRQYERVEVWRPARDENRNAIQAAFVRGFSRRWASL